MGCLGHKGVDESKRPGRKERDGAAVALTVGMIASPALLNV
jgi:hypothetical protein